MRLNREKFVLYGLLIGLVLGIIVGLLLPEIAVATGFFGILFLNALKMTIVPLVVVSVVTGVISIGDVRHLGKFGAVTLGYYLTTTALSVFVGIIVVNVIQPGVGGHTLVSEAPLEVGEYSILDVILGMFPPNIIEAASRTEVLPLIVSSIIIGAVLSTMGKKAAPLTQLFVAANELILKIVGLIMLIAPLGVYGLIAGKLGTLGWDLFKLELVSTAAYSATVMLGLGLHAFVILPLILVLFTRRSPWQFGRKIISAVITAFSTSSSSATLPVTLRVVEQDAGISGRVAGFVLPLGATINMDGTALYEAVAAIFIAQLYGVDLTLGTQVVIFLTAILASVGAAGIPQAGLVTMVMVLNAAGLPTEGIANILAVDWLLDRFRTSTNVWGDTIGCAVIESIDNRQPA